jgi:hypothetical protein
LEVTDDVQEERSSEEREWALILGGWLRWKLVSLLALSLAAAAAIATAADVVIQND